MVDTATGRDHNKKKKSRDYVFRARKDCAAVGDRALYYVSGHQRYADARAGWRPGASRGPKNLRVARAGEGARHEDAQWPGSRLQEFTFPKSQGVNHHGLSSFTFIRPQSPGLRPPVALIVAQTRFTRIGSQAHLAGDAHIGFSNVAAHRCLLQQAGWGAERSDSP